MHEHTLLILGCGWLGSRVAELAIARGWKVTATLRNPEKATRLQAMGCQVVLLDFDTPLDCEREFKEGHFVVRTLPATKHIVVMAIASRFGKLGAYLSTSNGVRPVALSAIGIYTSCAAMSPWQPSHGLEVKMLRAEGKRITFAQAS